jgi:GWxTD domain-containing protein
MKKLLFLCLIMTSVSFTYAQNNLGFEFDYARFNYDSASVYMEFYYELNPKNMIVIQSDKGPLYEAIVHIEMKDSLTKTFFINRDWKIQNFIEASSGDSLTARTLVGVLGFVVPNGKYSLKINARDSKNAKLTKNIAESIDIEPITKGKFCISDIQLATSIKTEDVDNKSIFFKNTLEVVPNPAMYYTKQSPALFYYAEMYQLKLADDKTIFSLQKMLSNSSGKVIFKNSKPVKQSAKPVVEYGVVNLSKYPTGSYTLTLSLIDPATNQAFVSKKKFFLYNPSVIDSTFSGKIDQGFLASEFANFSAEECDKLCLQSKYISSQKEIDLYKGLDSLKAKREFLYSFWKGRDPSPGTQKNEFFEEYKRRIDYVEENFTTARKNGYLTDRGRVVLLYGIPDQRDYFSSDANMKPYETWFYNQIESGVYFYFGDLRGFGDYELLNSTKRDEVKDDTWQNRLKTHE